MKFSKAKITDILRCSQRDEMFVQEMEDNIQSIFKSFGAKSYHNYRRSYSYLSILWYYFMTTLGNLQTLGEEYTGIIRMNKEKNVPSKLVQIVWLSLYLGGESIVDRLLQSLKTNVDDSKALTSEAKIFFAKMIDFIQSNKQTVKHLHHSLFYINGNYYNIANRITGIRYVLVRHWLEDNSFTQSFRILGKLSMIYAIFNLIQDAWSSERNINVSGNSTLQINRSIKGCVLCSESRKNSCATPCGHVFCWECIYDSLSYQQNCPICREVVNPSRIIFLQNYL